MAHLSEVAVKSYFIQCTQIAAQLAFRACIINISQVSRFTIVHLVQQRTIVNFL